MLVGLNGVGTEQGQDWCVYDPTHYWFLEEPVISQLIQQNFPTHSCLN